MASTIGGRPHTAFDVARLLGGRLGGLPPAALRPGGSAGPRPWRGEAAALFG